jgi:hypothetical protein
VEDVAMRVGRTCGVDDAVTVVEAFVADRPPSGTFAWTTDRS